jgi:hypothetical protein
MATELQSRECNARPVYRSLPYSCRHCVVHKQAGCRGHHWSDCWYIREGFRIVDAICLKCSESLTKEEMQAWNVETSPESVPVAEAKVKMPAFKPIECPVCLGSVEELQADLMMIQPCGHTVCGVCLAQLIDKRCPTCRGPIKSANKITFG